MQLMLLQAGDVQPTGGAQFWLWFTAGGFVLATVFFLYLATRGRAEDYHHYLTSAVITLWAGIMYALMASGSGVASIATSDGSRPFYFLRYVDWLITTPLLLLGLSWVGLGVLRRASRAVTLMVGADVLMIIFGLIAGVTGGGVKWLWFIISSIFFIAVLVLLWGPVRSAVSSDAGGMPGLFLTLAAMLSILWVIYPIVWIVGTEGVGVVSIGAEVFFFAVLDILAKIAFGMVLLGGVRKASGASGVMRSARVA